MEWATYSLAMLEKALKEAEVESTRIGTESGADVLSQISETQNSKYLRRSPSRESLISVSSNL